MRRLLCALGVLALVVAGCTKSQPAPPPTDPPPSPSPSPEPPPVAPLTGELLREPVERPVLGIKVDNANAALPPDGLEDADIVFEEEVEGGITRFLALFHSKDPGEVGPVRSGRSVDADLLPAFDAALALSGGSKRTKRILRSAGVVVIEDDDMPDAFPRVPDRIAPHNLFATTGPVFEAADERLDPPAEPVFAFDDQTPDGGRETTSALLEFSVFANATWTWKQRQGHWERQQNNSEHVTAEGDVITADNVVVMRVETRQGEERDSGGNPTLEMDVIGQGRGVVLRDGQAYQIRWRKQSADDQIQWLSRNGGQPLPLRPGKTWIELLPVDASLDLEQPRPRATDAATEAATD